jgi:hypothetical protein
LVTGEGNDEYEGSYEKILPIEEGDDDQDWDSYYLWNKAQYLFELV